MVNLMAGGEGVGEGPSRQITRRRLWSFLLRRWWGSGWTVGKGCHSGLRSGGVRGVKCRGRCPRTHWRSRVWMRVGLSELNGEAKTEGLKTKLHVRSCWPPLQKDPSEVCGTEMHIFLCVLIFQVSMCLQPSISVPIITTLHTAALTLCWFFSFTLLLITRHIFIHPKSFWSFLASKGDKQMNGEVVFSVVHRTVETSTKTCEATEKRKFDLETANCTAVNFQIALQLICGLE